MDYYEDVAVPQLADEFYGELRSFFQKAAETLEAYGIRERDLRRVNLERFPYHFLFSHRWRHCSCSCRSASQPTAVVGNPPSVAGISVARFLK